MFTPVRSKPTSFHDLYEAWISAALQCRVAWHTWLASDRAHRGDAYAGYCASLDREEHAAEVLAAAVDLSRNRRAVRSSLV